MSAAPPSPIDPNFVIELPSFEGPLDLLVHLIHKHELDVLDLPIAFVTERYVDYIHMMKQLNLDVASEYLVMAAELARIKSKMLLPRTEQEDEEDEVEEMDPRAELIRRLLEFQKYKLAGQELGARGVAGRDVFTRGSPALDAQGPAPLAEIGVFKLLDALKRVMERAKADISLEITAERISIKDRISELADLLRERRGCSFDELFEGASSTYDIVVTFLAMLEMAKGRMIRIHQPDVNSLIHIEYRLLEADADALDLEVTADGGEPEAQAAEGEDSPVASDEDEPEPPPTPMDQEPTP